MATLVQLQAEPWWGAEFTPDPLDALADRLAAFWGVPRTNMGTKGNEAHLSGYHRSRRWVKNSAYCVSRTYSVSRTEGDRSGGDGDAVCALDFKPATQGQLYEACRRLDEACRAGRLEKLTEWFGTFDGERVTGWDNISNRPSSSDSSHLWHGHLSFNRGRVDEDHDDVYEILTGDTMELTDQVNIPDWLKEAHPEDTGIQDGKVAVSTALGSGYAHARLSQERTAALLTRVDSLAADLAELKARPPVQPAPVDPEVIRVAVAEALAGLPAAVAEEQAQRLAE